MLQAIDTAAGENLQIAVPKSAGKKSPFPGWSESIQPFKEDSLFWHSLWQSAGTPINTELHQKMKHTRNIYHYNIRKCKKAENAIRRNKLLDAYLNRNGDLFKER